MYELFENDLQEWVDRLEKHSKDGFPGLIHSQNTQLVVLMYAVAGMVLVKIVFSIRLWINPRNINDTLLFSHPVCISKSKNCSIVLIRQSAGPRSVAMLKTVCGQTLNALKAVPDLKFQHLPYGTLSVHSVG